MRGLNLAEQARREIWTQAGRTSRRARWRVEQVGRSWHELQPRGQTVCARLSACPPACRKSQMFTGEGVPHADKADKPGGLVRLVRVPPPSKDCFAPPAVGPCPPRGSGDCVTLHPRQGFSFWAVLA